MDFSDLRYWKVGDNPYEGFRWFYCPILEQSLPLAVLRDVYKELKLIEKVLPEGGYKGWIIGTFIENSHVIKMLHKLKGVPFKMTPEGKNLKLWFYKET